VVFVQIVKYFFKIHELEISTVEVNLLIFSLLANIK